MNIHSADGNGIDGIEANTLIRRIAGWASYYQALAVKHRKINQEYNDGCDYAGARGHFDEFLRCRSFVGIIVHPLKQLIERRTLNELIEARSIIAEHRAWFNPDVCDAETCEDCDHPLRHHIVVRRRGNSQTIDVCPFGRQFWALARAIQKSSDDDAPRALLMEIARATGPSKSSAPNWKRAMQDLPF